MPNETIHFNEWLVSYLKSDIPLMNMVNGVYEGTVPEDIPFPVVRFQLVQPTSDVIVVNQVRIMTRMTYLIEGVVNEQGLTTLRDIADRLDDLLHKSVGETDTLRVMSCVREAPVRLDEPVVQGRYYRHAGGLYTVQVQAI